MPSFKPKANKKISVCDKASTTLDSKHQEKMDEFAGSAFIFPDGGQLGRVDWKKSGFTGRKKRRKTKQNDH